MSPFDSAFSLGMAFLFALQCIGVVLMGLTLNHTPDPRPTGRPTTVPRAAVSPRRGDRPVTALNPEAGPADHPTPRSSPLRTGGPAIRLS